LRNLYLKENINIMAQSAVEWLHQIFKQRELDKFDWEQAMQIEMKKCISDYNAGYDDAKCNHVNDAENYANEIRYINQQ